MNEVLMLSRRESDVYMNPVGLQVYRPFQGANHLHCSNHRGMGISPFAKSVWCRELLASRFKSRFFHKQDQLPSI